MRTPSDLGRRLRFASALAGALVAAACTEDLGSGATCGTLCPDESLATRDTILNLVVLDTSLAGYPGVGREGVLPLIQRGDTADTRAVVRFDSLPRTFTPTGGAATPYGDLASAILTVAVDSAGTSVGGSAAVEAYDVGAVGVDTDPAALAALVQPARLLGRASFASRAELGDTLRLALDPAAVLARVQSGERLRVGLVLRSAGSAQVNLSSFDGSAGGGARLRLRTSADTAAQSVVPISRARAGERVDVDLRDFIAVVRGPGQPAATTLAIGGVRGRRALLQFAVPPSILDSATVVRATLELTQAPNRATADRARSFATYVQPGTATTALADTLPNGALRDPGRVAAFVCVPPENSGFCPTLGTVALTSQFRLDSIRRAPVDSGPVRLEIATLIRLWQLPNTSAASRVVVLRAPLTTGGVFESQQGGELLVYSTEAPAAVRPRIRLTYVTRSSYSLP